MTNTRITDAEVFERRYPVILREFSLRQGSAGGGLHPGGEGVVRDIEFRIPVQVSILSERRVYHPYGLGGGEDAACGKNIWVRRVPRSSSATQDRGKGGTEETVERKINLGGKNTAAMQAGERIVVMTPGGGGWGREGGERKIRPKADPTKAWRGGSVAERAAAQEGV